MSRRPVVAISMAPQTTRLAAVLAAGTDTGGKQAAPSYPVIADDFNSLPTDVQDKVYQHMVENIESNDPCQSIMKLCAVNKLFAHFCKQEGFYKVACKVFHFDRADRTTGFHHMFAEDDANRWKKQFQKWCGLRFKEGNALRQAVVEVTEEVEVGPSGAAVHHEYGPIGTWDVSRVTDMSYIFNLAESFNGDISKWDVSSVTTMENMFFYTYAFNRDISKWDVSNVTNMNSMFAGAESFTGDISKWVVSGVTDMYQMFYGAYAFNRDISKWDVSNVTDMGYMFGQARIFNADISEWVVSNVTNMNGMFWRAHAFNRDIRKWDVSNVTKMIDFFVDNLISMAVRRALLLKTEATYRLDGYSSEYETDD